MRTRCRRRRSPSSESCTIPRPRSNTTSSRRGTKLLSRLNMVFASARYGDGEPTQGMREVFDLLTHAFDEVDARWKTLVSTDLAKLDAAAAAAGAKAR